MVAPQIAGEITEITSCHAWEHLAFQHGTSTAKEKDRISCYCDMSLEKQKRINGWMDGWTYIICSAEQKSKAEACQKNQGTPYVRRRS